MTLSTKLRWSKHYFGIIKVQGTACLPSVKQRVQSFNSTAGFAGLTSTADDEIVLCKHVGVL